MIYQGFDFFHPKIIMAAVGTYIITSLILSLRSSCCCDTCRFPQPFPWLQKASKRPRWRGGDAWKAQIRTKKFWRDAVQYLMLQKQIYNLETDLISWSHLLLIANIHDYNKWRPSNFFLLNGIAGYCIALCGNSCKSISWFCSVLWRLNHSVQMVLVDPWHQFP